MGAYPQGDWRNIRITASVQHAAPGAGDEDLGCGSFATVTPRGRLLASIGTVFAHADVRTSVARFARASAHHTQPHHHTTTPPHHHSTTPPHHRTTTRHHSTTPPPHHHTTAPPLNHTTTPALHYTTHTRTPRNTRVTTSVHLLFTYSVHICSHLLLYLRFQLLYTGRVWQQPAGHGHHVYGGQDAAHERSKRAGAQERVSRHTQAGDISNVPSNGPILLAVDRLSNRWTNPQTDRPSPFVVWSADALNGSRFR
jgi:hypothetical protein